jgi:hypothetical protein
MAIWHICWLFGIFSPILVSITEINLATLVSVVLAIGVLR